MGGVNKKRRSEQAVRKYKRSCPEVSDNVSEFGFLPRRKYFYKNLKWLLSLPSTVTNTAVSWRQRAAWALNTVPKQVASYPTRSTTKKQQVLEQGPTWPSHPKDHHTQQENQGNHKNSCHLQHKVKVVLTCLICE